MNEKQTITYRKAIEERSAKYQHYSTEELRSYRFALASRLDDVKEEINALGLSRNRRTFMQHTIPGETVRKHKTLCDEQKMLELEIGLIKENLRQRSVIEANFRDVVKEAMGEKIYKQFAAELERRELGEPPIKIKVKLADDGLSEQLNKYKTLAKEMLGELLAARKQIDAWVRSNEPEINKADFFNSTKTIRTCLPILSELIKRERTFY